MTTALREVLHDELERVEVPTGDLAGVRRRGGRIRTGRRAAAGGVGMLAAGTVVGVLLLQHGGAAPAQERGVQPLGRLDYSEGLRAYADPGVELHLGGRTFSYGDLAGLDTDAAATPDGIVYYDHGVPLLLDVSGRSRELEPGADRGGFTPTAKADAANPWVAYGAVLDGRPTVVVRDTGTGQEVAHREAGEGVVIDALDDGVVLLRDGSGTVAWDVADGTVARLAGPDTRVADLRGGTLLYDGPVPDGPAASRFDLVKGAIDSQLTHDGKYVLGWSPTLEATDGGEPLRLDLPRGATFFTIDTDGSVLAAALEKGGPVVVYDCPVSTAPCERLGDLSTEGGDPEFIGNDM